MYIKGPTNTPYNGGIFIYIIDLPNDFPKSKPKVRIKNKICHLQVCPNNGKVDSGFLWGWKSSHNMKSVVLFCCIYLALEDQNPDDIFDGLEKFSDYYKNNKPEFNRIAEEWTKKYTNSELPNNIFQLYTLKKLAKMGKTLEKLKNSLKNNNNNSSINNLNTINLKNENHNNCDNSNIVNNNYYNFISLHFISNDSSINLSICCRTDELFTEVETKLYKKVPKLQSINCINFLVNDNNNIMRSRSLRDNNIIEDGTKIIINYG